MRIHTDHLTHADIVNALADMKIARRIPAYLTFKTLTEHGSRDYARSFEVQLESLRKEEGDGRRSGNSGAYGAMQDGTYAATFDEWGWFLSELFAKDEYMRVGSKGYPIYRDDDDFYEKTGLSYNPEALRSNLNYPNAEEGEDPFPFIIGRTGGQAGQRGRGRSDGENLPSSYWRRAMEEPGKLIDGYVRYAPRTLADVPA